MTFLLIIFGVGLALSAFFSGSETGFYRVPRLRLVIDGVAGDRIAKGLLWASNNPAAFVATALVGNNVANYLASYAVVELSTMYFPFGGLTAELLFTIAVTPVVFIFGELMPKKAFLDAPYRLLRYCTPLLALFGFLLLPISGLLWLGTRILSWIMSTSIEPIQLSLRRKELTGVFEEGEEAGILSPAQRDIAQATFLLGGRPIRSYMTPVGRQLHLTMKSDPDAVIRIAKRARQDALPIKVPDSKDDTAHMVRASRCLTLGKKDPLPVEPIPTFKESDFFLHVITQLESLAQPLAAIENANGKLLGYVRLERLQQELLTS